LQFFLRFILVFSKLITYHQVSSPDGYIANYLSVLQFHVDKLQSERDFVQYAVNVMLSFSKSYTLVLQGMIGLQPG